MRVYRRMAFFVHFAEPLGQKAVKRHGNHDACHTDVAVVHDLVRVEHVAETDDDDHQRAGSQRHRDNIRPQIEASDIGFTKH